MAAIIPDTLLGFIFFALVLTGIGMGIAIMVNREGNKYSEDEEESEWEYYEDDILEDDEL